MALVTRRQVLGLVSALLGIVAVRGRAKSEGQSTSIPLRILATTDLHCWLAPYDYYRDSGSSSYGFARLATLIGEARRESSNTLLVDDGDLLQGNPLADFIARERGMKPGEMHPAFKALNLAGYDVATLGNHDFDYGLPFLERALAGATFPYVCANVVKVSDGAAYFHPYVLLDRRLKDSAGQEHAVRIGVFGVLPPQVAIWNRREIQGKLAILDIFDTARTIVPKLRAEGAELIIALCHSGFGRPPHVEGEENAAYAVSQLDGVDVVIAGHSHRVFPDISYAELPGLDLSRGTLAGKPAVMAGFFGNHLGVIDLTLTRAAGKLAVTAAEAHTRALHGAAVATDPAISAAIADDHHAAIEYARRPVGTLARDLDTYFAMVAPSPLLGLIAEVQDGAVRRAMADEPELFDGYSDAPLLIAVAPLKCGGRMGPENYSRVEAGDIAIRNVADIYLYQNLIEVLAIDGAALREWLEMSAMMFRQIHTGRSGEQALLDRDLRSFDFDVMYGARYAIDVAQPPRYRRGGTKADPAASRVLSLTVGGKPVKDDDRFLVATTNYRAAGGGGFPGMDGARTIYRSPEQMQELIVSWFRERHMVDVSGSCPWRFAPFPKDATVVFESAPEAAKAIPAGSGITYIEPMPDGFAKFRLQAV